MTPVPASSPGHRLAEAGHERLGGPVGGVARGGLQAGDRRDVQHRTAAAGRPCRTGAACVRRTTAVTLTRDLPGLAVDVERRRSRRRCRTRRCSRRGRPGARRRPGGPRPPRADPTRRGRRRAPRRRPVSSVASALSRASSRATTTRSVPSAASWRAISRPMPDEAPVTSAVRHGRPAESGAASEPEVWSAGFVMAGERRPLAAPLGREHAPDPAGRARRMATTPAGL